MSAHLSRHARRASVLLAAVGLCGALASPTVGATDSIAGLFDGRLPNNFPSLNGAGTAATYSTAGFVLAGLIAKADGNITGSQQGVRATPETLNWIATYELELGFAQQFSFSVGSLTACGAKGGPQNLSAQQPAIGRFDLFDAWKNLKPGSCGSKAVDRDTTDPGRALRSGRWGDMDLFKTPSLRGLAARAPFFEAH